jgi:hypothetical protein
MAAPPPEIAAAPRINDLRLNLFANVIPIVSSEAFMGLFLPAIRVKLYSARPQLICAPTTTLEAAYLNRIER